MKKTTINATQLMIGNLVEYNGYKMKVYSIAGPAPHKDPRFDNKHILDLFDGGGLLTVPEDEVYPIEITKETILEILKFKEESSIVYKGKIIELGVEARAYSEKVYMEIGGIYIGSRIKYIHEYENLCHSLTGNRLELF